MSEQELELEMVSQRPGFDRMVRACFLIICCSSAIIGLARLIVQEYFLAIPSLTIALTAWISLMIIRTIPGLLRAMYILCFVVLLGQVFQMITGGGLYSPNVIWLVALPILGLVLPASKILRMTFSFLIVLNFFFWAPKAGWIELLPPPTEGPQLLFRYINTVLAVIATVAGCFVLRRGYKDVFSELIDREKKLAASEQKLQRFLEERNGLLRMLTHDLATPLMSLEISLYQMEKNKIIPVENAKKMRLATSSIKDISSHVRELIAIESGKAELSSVVTDLQKVLVDVRDLLQPSLAAKDVSLTLETVEGELPIHSQEIHLRNIFLNLLSNGIKFSPSGSELKLICRREGGILKIRVQDKGIGIPADMVKDLFSFNKKTSRLGTNGEKGTGFGMPLVLNYIMALHGQIEVQSQTAEVNPLEHGTTFIVTLPLVQEASRKKIQAA